MSHFSRVHTQTVVTLSFTRHALVDLPDDEGFFVLANRVVGLAGTRRYVSTFHASAALPAGVTVRPDELAAMGVGQ